MKSTNTIITILVLILITGGIYFTLNNNLEDVKVENKITEEMAMVDKEKMENDTVVSTTSDTMMKDDMLMQKEAEVKGVTYEAYSSEKIMNITSGDVVLFFKASWCPSCRAADADIKKNIENIPANLTILEVDYDKSADLKKKYGVTTQHTFVQVDKDGNMIKKWTGGNTLNSVVAEVK